MDPNIAARAQRRWRVALAFSALATTVAVVLALWGGAVTARAAGADADTLFVVLIVSIAVIAMLIGGIGGISWWILKRRGALGPSLLWGADGATRRRVIAGLRGQRRLEGVERALALNEAERTSRFGLLLPGVMFTNVVIQLGWLALGWEGAASNPVLLGTRVFAVFFFGWGGVQGLMALSRARRYLARYGEAATIRSPAVL